MATTPTLPRYERAAPTAARPAMGNGVMEGMSIEEIERRLSGYSGLPRWLLDELRSALAARDAMRAAMPDDARKRADTFAELLGYATKDANSRAEAAETALTAARAALADLFAMMDEGLLVRNTENDGRSDWAIRSLAFVQRLKAAQQALSTPGDAPNGGVDG